MGIMLNKHADLPITHKYPRRDENGGALGIRENFASNLSRILRDKKVSQATLAAKIGLTQGSISGWITLRDWPSPENVDKVVDFLGVPAGALFADPKELIVMPKPEDELFDVLKMAAKKAGFKVSKKTN